MATTPIWVPLVVALLGLGGILLTQHHANRREDARWRRERDREQALWAREDAARSYEHRQAAYADFIKEFHRRWAALIEAREEALGGRSDYEPMSDYLDPLYHCLVQIQIFGTKEAAELAVAAFGGLLGGVVRPRTAIPDDVLEPLMQEVRRDLSIPTGLTSPRQHDPYAAYSPVMTANDGN